MNNDQHLAGSSNIPFVHLRAAWLYGQVSQSHESCGRSIIIWRRWFRSQRALGTGNGMRWTGLRYPDDIWPSRNPKTKRIPNCCEHLFTFELLGHCIKLPQPFGYGIVWLKMIEPQNWTLGWRLKIGRLLWLHWYSKLFSMNLTRQTLPISFRFPSENTETPIFKRLVCRMGYAKFRHVSCWNSQCLWVYICHCFQSHWTPSIGCRSAIIFHNRPLSSIICHLHYLSFSPPSSKKHIFWGFLMFYWLQRPFFTHVFYLSSPKSREICQEKYGQDATNVGDEGGFAPNVTESDEALQAWKPKIVGTWLFLIRKIVTSLWGTYRDNMGGELIVYNIYIYYICTYLGIWREK